MKDTTKNVDTNIFKSNSQFLHGAQAEQVRPIYDRILLRDIADPDKIGSIWIPQTAAERGVGKDGRLRLGVVVAIGPGDPFKKEWVERDHLTGQHQVMRKSLGACEECGGTGWVYSTIPNMPAWQGIWNGVNKVSCLSCHGDGVKRWPMLCKVGDTVLYDVRREAEIFLDGVRHTILYELQSVLAVMEP